tara:strand:+ start:679 stop:858 length:180 start_codon:yes stop_codon:yes gene_type:complete
MMMMRRRKKNERQKHPAEGPHSFDSLNLLERPSPIRQLQSIYEGRKKENKDLTINEFVI